MGNVDIKMTRLLNHIYDIKLVTVNNDHNCLTLVLAIQQITVMKFVHYILLNGPQNILFLSAELLF